MAKKAVDINPVFNHRNSVGLLDTAEALVDSLDNLSVCLSHIQEKYIEEEKGDIKKKHDSLFSKLKENLEKARELTDTLKREKWRLSRREMSVELRMGELEEYKLNLKRDMTDMNQTVDCLSMRIVQLENALCEAQEVQEATDAEKKQLADELEEAKKHAQGLEAKYQQSCRSMQNLKLRRTDSSLKQEHDEMKTQVEVLLMENARLKEMIREKDGRLDSLSESSSVTSDPAGERTGGSKKDSNSDTVSIGSVDRVSESGSVTSEPAGGRKSRTKKDSNSDAISVGSMNSEGGTSPPVIRHTTEIEYV